MAPRASGRDGGRTRGRAGSRVVPGKLPTALFDTPLVLAYRRTTEPALSFALGWLGREHVLGITYLTALDVLADAADADDQRKRREFLENVVVFTMPSAVVLAAEKLLWAVPAPVGLTGNDAVVAAAALIHKLPLYSLDPGRYAAVPG